MVNILSYNQCAVQLQEVPDEIALSFYICQCPHHCVDCSSPWLHEIGRYKLLTNMEEQINKYPYITCVCFMGGDLSHEDLIDAAKLAKAHGLKTAFYSGDDELDEVLIPYIDYYKVGHWDQTRGPLNEPEKTNQHMYKVIKNGKETLKTNDIQWQKYQLIDITYKFKHTM